jgi:AraC-like DNA-binding protein
MASWFPIQAGPPLYKSQATPVQSSLEKLRVSIQDCKEDPVSSGHVHHGSEGTAATKPELSNLVKAGLAVTEPSEATPVVRQKRLRRVLEMIRAEPCISVRELAIEVRLSPAYLRRLFKHEAGVHISDVVAERKLQTAAQLLSASDMPIKEIAFAVGYQHHSSFVRAFQRRFGRAPRDFRNER